MATSLENLSKKDSATVSQALQHNARTLKATAEAAAMLGNYGVARSLLILSAEESIKGAILFLKSVGVNVTSKKEIRIALKAHKERHEVAMLFKFFKIVEAFILSDDVEQKSLTKYKWVNQAFQFIEQLSVVTTAILEVGDDFEWWKKADSFKNDGLYVGFKGKLSVPQEITQEDYASAVIKVDDLMKRLRILLLVLKRANDEQKAYVISGLNEALDLVNSKDEK